MNGKNLDGHRRCRSRSVPTGNGSTIGLRLIEPSIRNSLQQREHDPQERPGTTIGSGLTLSAGSPRNCLHRHQFKFKLKEDRRRGVRSGLAPATRSISSAVSTVTWLAGSRSTCLVITGSIGFDMSPI